LTLEGVKGSASNLTTRMPASSAPAGRGSQATLHSTHRTEAVPSEVRGSLAAVTTAEGQRELGRVLRAAREGSDLSYRDLREKTGLSLSHLQRLERGEVSEPGPTTLRRLAEALSLDYGYLMTLAGYA
jgi:ribosome-binding protein aMBF1 (putative translation factor)